MRVYTASYMQELYYNLDERWNSSQRERIRKVFRHYMSLRINSMHITAGDGSFPLSFSRQWMFGINKYGEHECVDLCVSTEIITLEPVFLSLFLTFVHLCVDAFVHSILVRLSLHICILR